MRVGGKFSVRRGGKLSVRAAREALCARRGDVCYHFAVVSCVASASRIRDRVILRAAYAISGQAMTLQPVPRLSCSIA